MTSPTDILVPPFLPIIGWPLTIASSQSSANGGAAAGCSVPAGADLAEVGLKCPRCVVVSGNVRMTPDPGMVSAPPRVTLPPSLCSLFPLCLWWVCVCWWSLTTVSAAAVITLAAVPSSGYRLSDAGAVCVRGSGGGVPVHAGRAAVTSTAVQRRGRSVHGQAAPLYCVRYTPDIWYLMIASHLVTIWCNMGGLQLLKVNKISQGP